MGTLGQSDLVPTKPLMKREGGWSLSRGQMLGEDWYHLSMFLNHFKIPLFSKVYSQPTDGELQTLSARGRHSPRGPGAPCGGDGVPSGASCPSVSAC